MVQANLEHAATREAQAELRGEFGVLRGEFGALRGEFVALREEFRALREQLSDNNRKAQAQLAGLMTMLRWMVGIMVLIGVSLNAMMLRVLSLVG